jgi:hypothetical protein
MSTESRCDFQFEIGPFLFIDIVGLINGQGQRLQKLKEIERGPGQFRFAEAEGHHPCDLSIRLG